MRPWRFLGSVRTRAQRCGALLWELLIANQDRAGEGRGGSGTGRERHGGVLCLMKPQVMLVALEQGAERLAGLSPLRCLSQGVQAAEQEVPWVLA